MTTIAQHRENSVLSKIYNYPEGIMSRKEWLKLKKSEGWTAREKTERNYAAEEKLKQWLYDNRDDNSGNPNWPPTKRYLEKKELLNSGIFKTSYRVDNPNNSSCYDITKIEFDYFKTL